MSWTFDKSVETVLIEEGGYVNDPKDPGGETKFGISKRANPDVDIKKLKINDAIEIYRKKYWVPAKVDYLPERLRNFYFHMVVMSGKTQACRTLQRACNAKGHNLVVDGLIGKKTATASIDLELKRLKAYRSLFYAKLIFKKPELERFYYGWFRRILRTK